MASSVFFKFKSQKEPSRVEFDGTGISVFELKRDIIIKSGLGDGTEFDLVIYNEDGSIEYEDDLEIIPRSTLVIARRLPPIKPGAGRAARYMSGKAPVNAKNAARKEQPLKSSVTKEPVASAVMDSAMTEEERMQAMFQQQSALWTAQQEEMSHQTPVFRPGGKKPQAANVPDHDPPDGYTCFRCSKPGHWIQLCPTNDDPAFDHRRRPKRTTGIPRSFLKTVAKPDTSDDGDDDDEKRLPGLMMTAGGDWVIAEPDSASWEQYQAKAKSSAASQQAATLGEKELQERGLECPIDKKMFIDPMKTPCCEKTFCNECITNALIESDFTCPGCQTDDVLIDNLIPDEGTSVKLKEYLEEKNSRKEKERSRSKTPKDSIEAKTNGTKQPAKEPADLKTKNEEPATKEPKKATKSVSPAPASVKQEAESSRAPSVKPSTSPPTIKATTSSTTDQTDASAKKRPAEELLENPKIPKGPKAMQQQQQQQPGPMGNMAQFPMMPNMPFDMMNAQQYGMGMNPMMFPMGMPGMGMGGFPNMNGFGMGNGGMAYGNGMFGNGMGFPGNSNMNGMPMMNGNMGGGQQGMGMNMGNTGAGHMGYPTQPKNFQNQAPSEEDNAYFRQPVNPHRHQSRQRRVRPSDYREL